MPRRKRKSLKRDVAPDPKHGDKMVSKFINCIMWDGKKSIAEQIFYGALDIIGEKLKEDPMEVFFKAFGNIRPAIEVRSRRIGGATYQVPTEVRPDRQDMLARRWVITAARNRSEKTMQEKLALELLDAYNNRGTTVKKKEDTHKMAEANKAFAHYRW